MPHHGDTENTEKIMQGQTREYGTLYAKQLMLMHEPVGEMTDEFGNKYTLLRVFPVGDPIVKSEQTGQCFVLDWESIVRLAKAQGIDASMPHLTAKEASVPSV